MGIKIQHLNSFKKKENKKFVLTSTGQKSLLRAILPGL